MSIWESDEEKRQRDVEFAKTIADPELEAELGVLTSAIAKGDVTLAQVGGFTEDELDSAYAGASNLVRTGHVDDALQVAGYLILIDPWRARNYYLAGVCFHHRCQYDLAVSYYNVALGFADDPVTLAAKGEALLRLDRRDEARACLEAGLACAPANDAAVAPYVTRAEDLLSTYLNDKGG